MHFAIMNGASECRHTVCIYVTCLRMQKRDTSLKVLVLVVVVFFNSGTLLGLPDNFAGGRCK